MKLASIVSLLSLSITSAFADSVIPAAAAPATPPVSSLPSILMLLVFVAIFYFLLIRPQMKRNKEQRRLLSTLEKGDEVISASGLYGKLTQVEDTSVSLEIADKVVVKMQKQAIVSLLPKGSVSEK